MSPLPPSSLWLVIGLALVIVVGVAWWLARRGRGRPPGDAARPEPGEVAPPVVADAAVTDAAVAEPVIEAPAPVAPPAPVPPAPVPLAPVPLAPVPLAPPPAPVPPAPVPYESVTVTVAPTPPRPPAPVVERVLAITPADDAAWAAAEPLALSQVQAATLALLVVPSAARASGEALAMMAATLPAGTALAAARGDAGAMAALARAAGSGSDRWLDSTAAGPLLGNVLAAVAQAGVLAFTREACRDIKAAVAARPARSAHPEPRLKPLSLDAARFAREAYENYPSVIGKAAFRERVTDAAASAWDAWRSGVETLARIGEPFEALIAAARFGEVQVERSLAAWRDLREAEQQLLIEARLVAVLHRLSVAVGEVAGDARQRPTSAAATLRGLADQLHAQAARFAEREQVAKGDPYVGRSEFENNRAALRKLLQADPAEARAQALTQLDDAAAVASPDVAGTAYFRVVGNACEVRLALS